MDLLIAGDVQTVLQGRVTPEALYSVSVANIAYALGGSALPHPGPLEIGETIIYEGIGHIFTVKGMSVETKVIKTAFLMSIERKPKELLKITKKQTINSLYEELIERYPKGFAIVGKGHFSKLSVAYLQVSPIYGENINVFHDKYWHSEILKDREAKLFGVVLKEPDPRAFYQNPNEKEPSRLFSHTHALAPLARHLLTDSELVSGTFWVEAIDHILSMSERKT